MNNKLIQFSLLSCVLMLLFASCSKQELLNQDVKTFKLTIRGSSTDTLEYLVKGKVMVTTFVSTSFQVEKILALPEGGEEVQIRKKGSDKILAKRRISSNLYDQKISIFYDGEAVYDRLIQVGVRGYAGDATLELVLNNTVLASGTQKQFPEYIYVNNNEGQTRELQIRKQGETEVLSRKIITSSPAEQSIKFFYDGTKILDNIDLQPPLNPANVNIIAKFKSILPNYTGPADLVFYKSHEGQMVPIGVSLKLPADGSFSSGIELPPLANGESYAYKIVKSGTMDAPYDTSGDVVMPLKFPLFSISNFIPGKTQLLMINDSRTSRTVPAVLKGTTYGLLITDIAEYF